MEKQLQEILDTLYEAEGLIEMALNRAPRNLERLAQLARQKCYHAADLAAALKFSVNQDCDDADSLEIPEATPTGDNNTQTDVAEKMFLEEIAPKLENDAGEPEFSPTVSDVPEPEPSAQELSEEDQELAETSAAELEAERKAAKSAIVPPNPVIPPVADMMTEKGLEQASAREAALDARNAALTEDEASEIAAGQSEAELANIAEATEFEEQADAFSSVDSAPLSGDIFKDEQVADFGGEEQDDEVVDEEEVDDEPEEEVEEVGENEAPARLPFTNRRPIATFFSINDKYRFRRELFANSNPEWLNALALLETLADINEAEDYLFDDLQFDPESLDVKAFIEIITRYYNS